MAAGDFKGGNVRSKKVVVWIERTHLPEHRKAYVNDFGGESDALSL